MILHSPLRLAIRPLLALVLAGTCLAQPTPAPAEAAPKPPRVSFPIPSPSGIVKQRVGLTDLEITYGRPGMRNRIIFGSLIPYDAVWRTGANQATTIAFSTPVKVGGTLIPAGTYELFTIPGKEQWTVIIHKNMAQWGAYKYDEKNDIARVTVTPVHLPNAIETFTVQVGEIRDDSAVLSLSWEKTMVPIRLEMAVVESVVAQIKTAMASSAPKPAGLYYQSAQFYFEHEIGDSQALEWVNEAVRLNAKAPYMMLLKAKVHQRLGQRVDARIAALKVIELGLAAEGKTSGMAVQGRLLAESLR